MKSVLAILLGILGITFTGAVVWGWVWNIIKLIHMAGASEITAMFILRVVGVFAAPLGAILGFF